jgi:hypothetical protein
MRESALPPAAALGRLREARRLANEHAGLTRNLSPHHRMHSVALRAETEELEGNWDGIRAYQEEVEQAVDANRDTPCVRNARCLLLCAAARAQVGDEAGARALEAAADEVGMEGHGYVLGAPRIRLALARRDLAPVAELVERGPSPRFNFDLQTLRHASTRSRRYAISGEPRRRRCRFSSRAPTSSRSRSVPLVPPAATSHLSPKPWSAFTRSSSAGTRSRLERS